MSNFFGRKPLFFLVSLRDYYIIQPLDFRTLDHNFEKLKALTIKARLKLIMRNRKVSQSLKLK